MKRNLLLLFANLIWISVAISATSLDNHYKEVTRLKKGDVLQSFSVENLDGSREPLLSTSNATLISIYTTWCSVCKIELKNLEKDYKLIREKNLPIKVVALNAGESPKKVEHYIKRRNLDLPTSVDRGLIIVQYLQVLGTPTILIFDKNQKLIYQGTELPETWVTDIQNQSK